MKSLYEVFGTDTSLENDKGVVIDYGVAKITVNRAGGANTKYQKVLEAKLRPYRRKLEAGTMDPELNRRLLAEVYAEAIITGWEGVTDTKNKPLAFNKENCVKVLIDLPDFFSDIIAFTSDLKNFRKAEIEEDSKNSEKS